MCPRKRNRVNEIGLAGTGCFWCNSRFSCIFDGPWLILLWFVLRDRKMLFPLGSTENKIYSTFISSMQKKQMPAAQFDGDSPKPVGWWSTRTSSAVLGCQMPGEGLVEGEHIQRSFALAHSWSVKVGCKHICIHYKSMRGTKHITRELWQCVSGLGSTLIRYDADNMVSCKLAEWCAGTPVRQYPGTLARWYLVRWNAVTLVCWCAVLVVRKYADMIRCHTDTLICWKCVTGVPRVTGVSGATCACGATGVMV